MENDVRPFDRAARAFVAGISVGLDRSLAVGTSDNVDIGYESANPSLQDALWPDAVYGLLNRLDRR